VTTPRATYRLQLRPGFGFREAAAAVPYLAALGVSHLYLSPIFEAAEGSQHGYDCVDPEHVRFALGGEAGLAELVAAVHGAGMAILLDIVPNHLATSGRKNRWWLDVLENGPASAYAHFFDVEWGQGGDDRVVLPILAERYGRSLANGALAVVRDGRGFAIRAGDARLPIAPRALGLVVRRAGETAHHAELAFVGDALAALPTPAYRDAEARRRRHRDKTVLNARLAALSADPVCARAIDDALAAANGDPVELDSILEAQAYRLAHWSVAAAQLSYRRFFDIASLVALRNEDPEVFEATHARTLALVDSGAVDGLRVDHIDGLRDPPAYLVRLRERAPATWIVVEKITSAGERLPESWACDGTTGYDFMEQVGGLLVDPDGERALTRLFEDFTGEAWDPAAGSRRARALVMGDALHSELAWLTELAARACAVTPACRDYTRAEIEAALSAIFAGYPVYRTYGTVSQRREIDRERIAAAAAAARDARPEIDGDLIAFLESALAFELASAEANELAERAQQMSGAIIAKGDEDTLSYRQVRLASRCEVGSELRVFARAPAAVHHALSEGRPRALLATSTHDSKRGEDVRARIAVLSELPGEWAAAVRRWSARADAFWRVAPDRALELLLWQELVGAWPLPLDRARAHARKVAREARRRTSWRRPDEEFEAAVDAWLEAVFGDTDLMADIAKLAVTIAPAGDRNSLAQLLVKLCAPGVPDFYQGCELRDDSLVDPDNRRAVDLAPSSSRQHTLRWVADATPAAVAATADLGTIKLWAIRRTLALRARRPACFDGAYRALEASGPHAHRVFAFTRGAGDDMLVAVATRLSVHADELTATTLPLPDGGWRDLLSDRALRGGACAAGELLRMFPIALLVHV
jgi:(1->4)-alpha-D-glucan 1-alpha-D-glucosylmutase